MLLLLDMRQQRDLGTGRPERVRLQRDAVLHAQGLGAAPLPYGRGARHVSP